GVTVTLDGGDNGVYTTTSASAGGYQIDVPSGSYTLTFSGGGLASPIVKTVIVNNENRKVDAIQNRCGGGNNGGGDNPGSPDPNETSAEISVRDTQGANNDNYVNFKVVTVNQTSNAQVFQVHNDGNAILNLTRIRLRGKAKSQFDM